MPNSKPKYYGMVELIEMIDEPNSSRYKKVLKDNLELFKQSYGATHNHQNWPGGYFDHVVEVMNRAILLYRLNPRPFSFSLSDALTVLFLHDIEKPWKHEMGTDGILKHNKKFKNPDDQYEFVIEKTLKYNIILTNEHRNALKYIHGEGRDYSSKRRVAGPLAAFCHICDYWAARIDFENPLAQHDPWPGAKRSSSFSFE